MWLFSLPFRLHRQICGDNYHSITTKHYKPYSAPNGREDLPMVAHQKGTGFTRQPPLTVPTTREVRKDSNYQLFSKFKNYCFQEVLTYIWCHNILLKGVLTTSAWFSWTFLNCKQFLLNWQVFNSVCSQKKYWFAQFQTYNSGEYVDSLRMDGWYLL